MIQGYTLATFPNITQYIYAQPEKQAKELCKLTIPKMEYLLRRTIKSMLVWREHWKGEL